MTFLLLLALPAQGIPSQEKLGMKEAVTTWLASDHGDDGLMAQASEAILDRGKKGLRYLAALHADSNPEADRFRHRALQSLISSVSIDFLQREVDRGMVYAGQFDPLATLQPLVGELFLDLVLATPDWFPENLRSMVVPALRDLYPQGPDRASLRALQRIAEDDDFETQALRTVLTYALAQWGERDLIATQIARLRENAGTGENEDQLVFILQLGRLHYELREYSLAAEFWTGYLRKMEALAITPVPFAYYNAACALCLSGKQEAAFGELERCAVLLRSPHIDSSAKIERRLFDQDPELRTIRSTRRFQKLVASIFTGKKDY